MKRVAILLSLLLVPALDSYACQRCGLFGNRCRYYKAPVQYVAPYVAPIAVKQADVFVVQNNYPQPIGAIAQQGNSVYGYNAAAQAYFVNPTEFARQSFELSKAAMATAQLGFTGYHQMANTQLALQASITEPIARGVAASQVLAAAGFTAPTQQSQSLALKITQNSNGQWQVLQADPVQVNAQVEAQIPAAPQAPASNSILAKHCARCHGLNLAEPKGGVFYDQGHRLSCDAAMKALVLVKQNKMPKDGAPLTPDEKGRLLDELLALSQQPPENPQ